jgi:Domain of unknown function (DUF4153)
MGRKSRLGIAVVVMALLLGVWGDVLFRGRPLGLNVALWSLVFVAGLALLLRLGGAPLHQGRRWMAGPLLLFSTAFVWHDSPLLTAANLLAVSGAVALGALRRTEPRVHRAGVADYGAAFAAAGASAFAGAVSLLRSDIAWDELGRGLRTDRTKAIGRGLVIGAPLLALFGGLFVAADAVFKHLATGLLPSFQHSLQHVTIVIAFAWLSAGLLRDLSASREEQRLVSPAAVTKRPLRFSLGVTELGVVLAALDLLFLAFVVVQLRYLFGGRQLVEAQAHLTYAQYARHGFFELVAASLLVLPLLLLADSLLRRERRRDTLIVRALSATLLALVFVVMASALQRMRLYEHQYGLTELRLYATGVIFWLGAVLIWFGFSALRGRRHLFAVGALAAGFVATAALNLLNPDAFIARTNLNRPHVDAGYVASLSDDAVPTLVQLLPRLSPPLRSQLAAALLRHRVTSGGWEAFNLARNNARTALAANHAELVRLARGAPSSRR